MCILIYTMHYIKFINLIFEDTHALVKFLEEDSTAIVPVQRIQQKETLEYGGSCAILWSNKKVYKAFLICSGIQIVLYVLLKSHYE